MEKTVLTVRQDELLCSERPLRSIRRSMIELRLIDKICNEKNRYTGNRMWMSGEDALLVLFDSPGPIRWLMIFSFDECGRMIKDQTVMFQGSLIWRGNAVSESKLYNLLRHISLSSEWTETSAYAVEYVGLDGSSRFGIGLD